MKKISTVLIISLLCFSTFMVIAHRVRAQAPYLEGFVQLTMGLYDDRNPHWSPDGSQLTWFTFDSSGWYRQLWKMNAGGTGKIQLTFGGVVDEGGDWSPDGTCLVFQRWGLRGIDGFDLMVMNSDGSKVRPITSSGLSHQNPSWSHNGSRIAYEYASGTLNPEVHVINPDGTDDIALSQNKYQPDWSPNDKHIVAVGSDGIWIIDTSSPYETRRIYSANSVSFPQFTPDGKYIVFRVGEGDLHLIDLTGNYVAQLTSDSTLDYSQDITSDGKWITFNSRESGNDDIWKARIVWPVSWELIFEDTRSRAMLKISTDDRYFQFITPEIQFPLKHDPNMRIVQCQYFTCIVMAYEDEEIKLTAYALDGRFDTCIAYAKDVETGKAYVLIDRPGVE